MYHQLELNNYRPHSEFPNNCLGNIRDIFKYYINFSLPLPSLKFEPCLSTMLDSLLRGGADKSLAL
jgi:hypothetical protein